MITMLCIGIDYPHHLNNKTMDREEIKQLAELNDKYQEVMAENERLKNQLKLFVDAMNAMADTTFIINH